MDLQERLDAEVWAQIMSRFVGILAEGVRKFGGTVDKFTGDGIMALFGAPMAQEDHARRACHAAWHLTKAIGEWSEDLRNEQGVELHVRLGLNSGEVVVGRVGEDVTLDPTALGHTVGLAQRMEAMAEPGTVYVTGATADLAAGYFSLRDVGAMAVKGVQQDVPVFQLDGPGRSRTPLEVAAARGFSPFVGRDRELGVLEAALQDAARGDGRVMGIVAEPGLGKSRLCHEFAERCRLQGFDVFAAHALAHARSVPFVPVLELLRAIFGIEDQDAPASARAKIGASVTGLDPHLESALPLFYDFLGVADPESPAPAMDPEARQRQIFAAVNRLRRARSARRPFVMMVEDLHWLDPGSGAFLENLVTGTPGSSVLVVTTCRPEYRAPWAHRAHYAQLPLGPLADDASDELLRGLLGAGVADEQVEWPQVPGHALHGCAHGVPVGDVGRHRHGPPARRDHVGHDGVQPTAVAAEQPHRHPLAGQGQRDVAADPPPPAGDQRDLLPESHQPRWTAPTRRDASATAASRAAVASSTVRVRSGARNRSAYASDALPSPTCAPR
jgi:class 3 adenylate cyclase